jgi:hypothetical protein
MFRRRIRRNNATASRLLTTVVTQRVRCLADRRP